MSESFTTDQKILIGEALKALASVCDHAEAKDFSGFNKPDQAIGHYLAEKSSVMILADDEYNYAVNILQKYKKTQIRGLGIDIAQLPVPPKPTITNWWMRKKNFRAAPMKLEDIALMPWIFDGVKTARDSGKQFNLWHISSDFIPQEFRSLYAPYKGGMAKEFTVLTGVSWSGPNDYHSDWQITWWEPIVEEEPIEEEEEEEEIKEHPIFLGDDLVFPDGFTFKDYQIAPVKASIAVLRMMQAVLLAHGTGVGKTYESLGIVYNISKKTQTKLNLFVMCPIAVLKDWEKSYNVFNDGNLNLLAIQNYEILKNGKMAVYQDSTKKIRGEIRRIKKKVPCSFITVEKNTGADKKYRPKLFNWNFPPNTIVIVDECQRCKGTKSQNAELLIALKDSGVKIILLSGTPAEDPLDFKALGYALDLFPKIPFFYHWTEDFGCSKDVVNRRMGQTAWVSHNTHDNMIKLNRVLYPLHGTTLRKEDIPTFPKNTLELFQIRVDTDVVPSYIEKPLQELQDALAQMDEEAMRLPVRQKRYQISELLKVPYLIDLTQDLLDDHNAVVIFTNFVDTVNCVVEGLKAEGIETLQYDGQMSQAEKDQAKDDFLVDRCHVIVVNIDAGGVGLNLNDQHGNWPRVSLVCPSDKAMNLKQALGRIHRANNVTPAIQRLVYSDSKIESKIMANLQNKINCIDALCDSDLDPVGMDEEFD